MHQQTTDSTNQQEQQISTTTYGHNQQQLEHHYAPTQSQSYVAVSKAALNVPPTISVASTQMPPGIRTTAGTATNLNLCSKNGGIIGHNASVGGSNEIQHRNEQQQPFQHHQPPPKVTLLKDNDVYNEDFCIDSEFCETNGSNNNESDGNYKSTEQQTGLGSSGGGTNGTTTTTIYDFDANH